jgi:integrase/recombinase XerD
MNRRDGADLEEFLEMMAAERGAAANTIASYRRDLADYSGFLARRNTTMREADTAVVRAYLASLEALGLKPSTAARRLSAIRQLHKHLYLDGHAAKEPTSTLAGPRKGRSLPKVLEVDHVEKLLVRAEAEATTAEKPLAALRMLALLELAYASGLRVTELVSLPRSAAKTQTDYLIVTGKGRKERLVPLTDKAKMAMRAYLEALDSARPKPSAFLFPNEDGGAHLARQVFGRDLKRLAGAAGLRADQISPHALRHAFASHLLQNGADLRVVQQLLGHADIATTQIYTHLIDDRTRAMVRDLHPLADDDEGET